MSFVETSFLVVTPDNPAEGRPGMYLVVATHCREVWWNKISVISGTQQLIGLRGLWDTTRILTEFSFETFIWLKMLVHKILRHKCGGDTVCTTRLYRDLKQVCIVCFPLL